jgi:hypothetical protein
LCIVFDIILGLDRQLFKWNKKWNNTAFIQKLQSQEVELVALARRILLNRSANKSISIYITELLLSLNSTPSSESCGLNTLGDTCLYMSRFLNAIP